MRQTGLRTRPITWTRLTIVFCCLASRPIVPWITVTHVVVQVLAIRAVETPAMIVTMILSARQRDETIVGVDFAPCARCAWQTRAAKTAVLVVGHFHTRAMVVALVRLVAEVLAGFTVFARPAGQALTLCMAIYIMTLAVIVAVKLTTWIDALLTVVTIETVFTLTLEAIVNCVNARAIVFTNLTQ